MEFFDFMEVLMRAPLWFCMIAPPLILLVLPIYKYVKYKKQMRLIDGLILCILFSIPWYWVEDDLLFQIFPKINFAAFLLPQVIILLAKWLKKFIGDFK